MSYTPHTQDQLKQLNIQEDKTYTIEYLDKDYFNGDENLIRSEAKAIVNDDIISFIITDSYGMDKFITQAKVIK